MSAVDARGHGARIVVGEDARLTRRLDALLGARIVCFAGLPGTGKSLLAHQLAHLAAARGRVVHLLQWDVARPIFETSTAGQRHPVQDGVTHAIVRKALGLWVRHAISVWTDAHANAEHLLIGETPLVGNRFVELARREDDQAEPVLASPSCRFVIPVPSRAVRAFLERERERRTAQPLHAREREDAPPAVLRALWCDLLRVAPALGVAVTPPTLASREGPHVADIEDRAWDPDVYRAVYAALLRHRHADVIPIDTVLQTSSLSVYDYAITPRDVVPGPGEADAFITDVERRYPSVAELEREVGQWYVIGR